MRVVAIDGGFSNYKGSNGNELENVLIPSIVVEGRRLSRKEGLADFNLKPLQNLDVMVNGNRYFVGDLAISQSRRTQHQWNSNRLNGTPENLVLTLTTIALLTGDDPEVDVLLATGLPWADYNDKLLDEYELNFPGTYKIEFLREPLKGLKKTICVNKVVTYLQGMGVFYDLVMDNEGNVNTEHPLLANDKNAFGLVDIGMRTSNIELYERQRNLEEFSGSKEIGMDSVHEAVRQFLTSQGEPFSDGIIEDIILDKESEYREIEGMNEVINDALRKIAVEIVELTTAKQWKEKFRIIKKIYVAGGGGEAVLPYLKELFREHGKEIDLVRNPQFSNANGFFKALNRAYKLGKVEL